MDSCGEQGDHKGCIAALGQMPDALGQMPDALGETLVMPVLPVLLYYMFKRVVGLGFKPIAGNLCFGQCCFIIKVKLVMVS